MKRALAGLVAALAVTGCMSTAPGAEKVVLTRDPKVVAGCKVIGPLHVKLEPFSSGTKELQNLAFGNGGDTVFLTSASAPLKGATDGVAYNCSGIDQRMPATVIVKPQ